MLYFDEPEHDNIYSQQPNMLATGNSVLNNLVSAQLSDNTIEHQSSKQILNPMIGPQLSSQEGAVAQHSLGVGHGMVLRDGMPVESDLYAELEEQHPPLFPTRTPEAGDEANLMRGASQEYYEHQT